MSSTADRWFVPDEVYDASNNDYALVRQSTVVVRTAILIADGGPYRTPDLDETFLTQLYHYRRCYDFAVEGRLVYADVDDEDPTHMETVYGEWAKEISIEQESKRTVVAKKKLVKACFYPFPPPSEFFQDDEENKPSDEDYTPSDEVCMPSDEVHTPWDEHKRNRRIARKDDLGYYDLKGTINDSVVSLLLTTKSVQDKKEMLNIKSGQSRRPTKRPVIALIDMVDSRQATEKGESKGWVTGYDFIKELLVIKPFVSKGGNHPLGGKWHGNVANDGVSFSGTPSEFTKAYIEFGKAVEAGNKGDGFKMLVHTSAADWIDRFGRDLGSAYGAELHFALAEAMAKIEEAMNKIKFPAVKKTEREQRGKPIYRTVMADDTPFHRTLMEDCKLLRRTVMADGTSVHRTLMADGKPFHLTLLAMNLGEARIRAAALDAKEQGDEQTARNTAKLYGHIHTLLEAFEQNPSMDLDSLKRGGGERRFPLRSIFLVWGAFIMISMGNFYIEKAWRKRSQLIMIHYPNISNQFSIYRG
ncbi:hypothetical protein MMC07_007293 [Pseudocyphellaria aurata]|nr:hypothetical protein [Pseudocyphellaria aurata]